MTNAMIAVKEYDDFRAAIATLANPQWRGKMTTVEDFKMIFLFYNLRSQNAR